MPTKLHKYHGISIIQDIIVVNLPPMFTLFLSREFTSKLGVYLAMNYSHMIISFKNKNFKILNEVASNFHTKKIAQANVLYEDVRMVNFFQEKMEIVDQVSNDILYHVEDISQNNYSIYKYSSQMLALSKSDLRETKIW